MAIAEAHLRAVYNRDDAAIVDHFTYCICGDGDLMEGISQEALSLAGHLKLGKLIVFYDDNRVSLAGPTDVTLTDDPIARFDASGWHTQFVDVDHGNDVETIDQAIDVAKNVTDRPSFIAVRTHIGYGSPRQDNYLAHGEALGPENVKKIEGASGLAARAGLLRARRRAGVLPRGRREGRRARSRSGRPRTTLGNAPIPILPAQLERALRRDVPADLPWPDVHGR